MSPHCATWISASRGFHDHYPCSTGLLMLCMISETREGIHRGEARIWKMYVELRPSLSKGTLLREKSKAMERCFSQAFPIF